MTLAPRLPAEWEPVDRVLVAWSEDSWNYLPFFGALIARASRSAQVTILMRDEGQRGLLQSQLSAQDVRMDRVSMEVVHFDTMWIRDYGPFVVKRGADAREIVDAPYGLDRLADDGVPRELAARMRWPHRDLGIEVEGGHIQSDGAGACVVTDDVLVRNIEHHDRNSIADALRASLGCEELVVVPTLTDEPTGHLDVFAYLTGPRQALVGEYAEGDDDENAKHLDEARDILVESGFAVRRIPMPANDRRDMFRTYTNALTVNDRVLVPVYEHDRRFQDRALAVFAQAFPGRTVETIPADDIAELFGMVHCVTSTIAR